MEDAANRAIELAEGMNELILFLNDYKMSKEKLEGKLLQEEVPVKEMKALWSVW